MTAARRILGRIALAVTAVLCLGLWAAPAASAAPTITYKHCESGASQFICFVSYSGAVGTVTVQWNMYWLNNYVGTFYGSSIGSYGCTPRRPYRMDLFVTDSTGTSSTSTAFTCNPNDWP